MAGALALTVAAPAWAGAGQAPVPQTVGIRIVDVPTTRTDDPRARQYIVDHLAPGTTITRRVEVSNDTGKTQAVQLYAGAASIANGSIAFADGRTPSDLTGWTKVEPATVSPKSGGTAIATVTIFVPANTSPGERYGVVWAELPPAVPVGGGVTAVNRVGVRIYLSVGPGGEPASDFTITTFEASRGADGNPLVTATVRNTGGRAVDLSGELRLTNGPGGLSAGPFTAKLGTTLGLEQAEPVQVALDPAITRGPWEARIVLRSGTTEREATATITFPDAPATAAAPVGVTSGGGSSILPVAAGGAVLLVIIVVVVGLARRRRRSPAAEPGPA
jgi:hypothetical protein